jgi:NAD(P)-dependent dehydrogenase (short-subunit alcohol dehydrogenase family)
LSKTILITGVTGDIGINLCKDALTKGYSVIGVGRDASKLKSTYSKLNQLVDVSNLSLKTCSFDDLNNLTDLCKSLVDVSINQVYLASGVRHKFSKILTNGFEIHYQVNFLAPLYLNLILSSRNNNCVFVNFGSDSMFRTSLPRSFDLTDVNKYSRFAGPYAKSKLLLAAFSKFFSIYDSENKWLTIDPGNLRTEMTTEGAFPSYYRFAAKRFFKDPQKFSRRFLEESEDDFCKFDSGVYLKNFQIRSLPKAIQKLDFTEFLDFIASSEESALLTKRFKELKDSATS